MFKATILFDLDGTLIDSTTSIVGAFWSAFESFKVKKPTKDEICRLIGYPLDLMFERLGAPSNEISDYVKAYKIAYRKRFLQETTLIDTAYDALEMAYEFADLGVVTTKSSKALYLLEHLGVAKFFKTIIGRDDVINPKPHPEPILKALHNLQKQPDKYAFMVGDTVIDAVSAKAAGIGICGVSCGYGDTKDLLEICDVLASTPLNAVSLIKNSINV